MLDGQILQANFIGGLDRRAERQIWGGTDTMISRCAMQVEQAQNMLEEGKKTSRKSRSGRQTGRLNLFFNPSIILSRVTAMATQNFKKSVYSLAFLWEVHEIMRNSAKLRGISGN